MEKYSLRQSGLFAPSNRVYTSDGWRQVQAGDITPGTTTLLKLGEVVGTGASGVMEFSSIPSTYRSLWLQLVGRSTGGVSGVQAVGMDFETTPTAGAYNHQRLFAAGSTVIGDENIGIVSGINLGVIADNAAPANTHGFIDVRINEYANTSTFKQILSQCTSGVNLNSGLYVLMTTGVFESLLAINRIRLSIAAGSWTTTSRATLWGLPA